MYSIVKSFLFEIQRIIWFSFIDVQRPYDNHAYRLYHNSRRYRYTIAKPNKRNGFSVILNTNYLYISSFVSIDHNNSGKIIIITALNFDYRTIFKLKRSFY